MTVRSTELLIGFEPMRSEKQWKVEQHSSTASGSRVNCIEVNVGLLITGRKGTMTAMPTSAVGVQKSYLKKAKTLSMKTMENAGAAIPQLPKKFVKFGGRM